MGVYRLFMLLAVLAAVCGLVARFYMPGQVLVVHAGTWLQVTGLLLLFAIAVAMEQVVSALSAKQA